MGSLDLAVVAVYFVVIIAFGAWAARHSRGARDFFLGGQRFAWWMVAFSCVATVVGSYSFVKYSEAGFKYGLSSSQTYLNDWYWMPLWMFGWLPIVYYARITSVPEYFERRFGRAARHAATSLLLLYLIGYLGINFLTMGQALRAIAGWDLFWSAALAALVCGVYTSHGGQVAVIFTDLMQGAILLVAGVMLFGIGVYAAGGFGEFWTALGPEGQRALPAFADPPEFNFVGIFWQDGFVGGIAFYFMNQSILMRFLSARSVKDARLGAAFVILILMPLAAIAVSGAGWVGRVLVAQGALPSTTSADDAFVAVAETILPPGLFGFVVAALVAALMSSADSLINAIATISVIDLWKPLRERGGHAVADERALVAARWASAIATVVGLALVPIFATFGTIYRAHGAFVAAVTPPLAVALVLAFVWKRFSSRAALLVMIGGSLLVAASLQWPVLVTPFAHGVDLESGAKGYSYIRALYGLVVCTALGVMGALIWPRREPVSSSLVVGPIIEKLFAFKGAAPKLDRSPSLRLQLGPLLDRVSTESGVDLVELSPADARRLAVEPGDLVTLRDAHWLASGYRALTGRVLVTAVPDGVVNIPQDTQQRLGLTAGRAVVVTRLL